MPWMKAVFEVRHKDILGRIGVLTVGGKKAETPAFVPVINPVNQVVPASEIAEMFNCNIVITNSYILFRRLRDEVRERGVHAVIGFDGIVMTDSGGYQVLQYGEVEASPVDVALFQEAIGSDIATPLDRPTGLVRRGQAVKTVEETLKNVKATMEAVGPSSRCVWSAPIQGGLYPDLVEKCVDEYRGMGFSYYCLGSPTPLMTAYKYDKLVSMISVARRRLGPVPPLHLFGAGHPMVFPIVVALGCDLFDSASYALFAAEDRYILPYGTARLDQLYSLPCSCSVCGSTTVKELRQMEKRERFRLLSLHNLNVCFQELNQVRQAIWEGRLFELLERRSRAHPALYQAFQAMLEDTQLIDLAVSQTPLSKRRGLFLYDRYSLLRPEVRRAMAWLEKFEVNKERLETAVLVNVWSTAVKEHTTLLEKINGLVNGRYELFTYGTVYGLIPYSLNNVFPYSQTTTPETLIRSLENEIYEKAARTLSKAGFKHVYVILLGRDAYPGFAKGLTNHLTQALQAEVKFVKPT
jgi:7-cyano-7-deazaguanine tRNA-ribosyltransferase